MKSVHEIRAAAHDEVGFESFHGRTASGLWRYLRRVGGDSALADDLVQESFLKFLLHPSQGSEERQQTAYLYSIATNLLRDRWRRRERQRGFIERFFAASEPVQPSVPQAADLRGDINAVLQLLRPNERAMLWLAYVEGYEHREIATILGLKAASIRVLLFRARGKMAKLLNQHGLGEVRCNDKEL